MAVWPVPALADVGEYIQAHQAVYRLVCCNKQTAHARELRNIHDGIYYSLDRCCRC